ncbi:MAG: Gfo/Idh/MocA family oxidoreductase, partial [Planctomycetes bacterium]|nr:Gfo/Idh/MocA family oxidoreductase [Planctomycetota bacterium]
MITTVKPLGIAFIGAGGIAGVQAKALAGMPEARVVACADPNPVARARLSGTYGVERGYADWREMLADQPDIDAVSVCTPNRLHAEPTIAALRAGKHVLVEKPMAMNAEEGQAMVDAARAAGRQLVVGFQVRFSPGAELIRRQIADGVLGRIVYARCRALRRRGIPGWGVFGRKDLQGGGGLIDIGVHLLEAAHDLMGSPEPVAATAAAWTYRGDRPMQALAPWGAWDHASYSVEDLAVGQVRFAGGACLAIESSFAAHIEQDVWELDLLGERGGATLTPCRVFTDQGGYQMDLAPGWLEDGPLFPYKMRHFVAVCRDGAPNRAPGEHGVLVQRMLDGLYASAAAGREVRLDAAA